MAADDAKDQEGAGIPWTEDAQALLKKVPFFIRKNVEKEAEEYARSHGMSRVEASVIVKIKASKSGENAEAPAAPAEPTVASAAPETAPTAPPVQETPEKTQEIPVKKESVKSPEPQAQQRGGANSMREYASFVVLRINPEWRKVHPAEVGHGKKEFADVVRNFESQVASSSYSLVGLTGMGDILLWRVGTNISLLQEMTGKLLSSYLGRYLTVERSFLGFLGDSGSRTPFVPRNSRFIHVRPLVRSSDWHELAEFVREGAEKERKSVVDRYPGVRVTIVSSYGFDESDLLMIMESDSAETVVDLNQALQMTQENRYLVSACRGLTGISRPLGEVLDMLGGV